MLSGKIKSVGISGESSQAATEWWRLVSLKGWPEWTSLQESPCLSRWHASSTPASLSPFGTTIFRTTWRSPKESISRWSSPYSKLPFPINIPLPQRNYTTNPEKQVRKYQETGRRGIHSQNLQTKKKGGKNPYVEIALMRNSEDIEKQK